MTSPSLSRHWPKCESANPFRCGSLWDSEMVLEVSTLTEKENIPETGKRDITVELRKAFADTSTMIRIPEQLEYQDQTSEKGSGRNTMKRDAGGMMEIGEV